MRGGYMMENNRQISAQQLMRKVCEAMFFMTELNLYLDTHPDDTKALRMFNEASENAKVCFELFQNRYYPLVSASADCDNDWEWLVGTWPSQKMA